MAADPSGKAAIAVGPIDARAKAASEILDYIPFEHRFALRSTGVSAIRSSSFLKFCGRLPLHSAYERL
ncbi:hypothetical protein L0F51_03105 [Afifella sp. H1R]|uniref:hypothetical protein n=1 Tax=Afifella sp. H1R TaxID=2908841 RepID=UPI001F2B1048|nr:hypothetical protein [Afifella sp. H1R]MCF1502755.1 hypothetical protein [Afifella sp. H1R]